MPFFRNLDHWDRDKEGQVWLEEVTYPLSVLLVASWSGFNKSKKTRFWTICGTSEIQQLPAERGSGVRQTTGGDIPLQTEPLGSSARCGAGREGQRLPVQSRFPPSPLFPAGWNVPPHSPPEPAHWVLFAARAPDHPSLFSRDAQVWPQPRARPPTSGSSGRSSCSSSSGSKWRSSSKFNCLLRRLRRRLRVCEKGGGRGWGRTRPQ